MIKLGPHEVCPYGDSCEHKEEFFEFRPLKCEGLNPDRDCDFVCEFFVEGHSSCEKCDSIYSSKT